MGKISMFGISGSGKTCYLYAMAQILQGGAQQDNFRMTIIANDMSQQAKLNEGYMRMAVDGKWPEGTNTTTEYNLCVRAQYDGMFRPMVDSLTLFDYTGGVWTNNSADAQRDRLKLMQAFADSSAVLFLVDGVTLLQAMDPQERHPSHKGIATMPQIVLARQQIAFVENLFTSFKNQVGKVPPVMVVLTKSDVFVDEKELQHGKSLVKQYLPSIFAKGSGIEAAMVSLSLGTHLGTVNGNTITGNLSLSTQYNIHLPIVYAVYAYLSETYYNSSPNEKRVIERWAKSLRAMMKNKVEMLKNGYPVIEV